MTPGEERIQAELMRDEGMIPPSSLVDPVLEALDPDRERPAEVMEAKKLCLQFGQKAILSDIDMSFQRGTITALIGPTGSG
ncbi:MAG TPA: hypothetical protein VGH31_00285, partial [Acidimicrobiales bacterium]